MREIWIVAVNADNATQGLAAKAVELNGGQGCRIILIRPQVEAAWGQGIDSIYHIPLDTELISNHIRAAETLVMLSRSRHPRAIFFLADTFGRMAAPWIAAALETGVTADCTAVMTDNADGLIQKRPTFGGRRIATIQTKTEPCVLTVRPGIYLPPRTSKRNVPIETILPVPKVSQLHLLERIANSESYRSLAEEDIILAGGLGLGSKENFRRLTAIAKRLGCGVGASRGAVAAGYAPYVMQVGQTGATVRPRIYVAFGISGQVQHLSGMSGSQIVISVNTDPNAPIFKVSNYALEADCSQVLRLIEQKLDNS